MWSSSTLVAASATARATPARFARVKTCDAAVWTARALRKIAVTPSKHPCSDSGRLGSASTTSVPSGRPAVFGWRLMARTFAPRASNWATRGRPTLPVAPVIKIMSTP